MMTTWGKDRCKNTPKMDPKKIGGQKNATT